MAPPYHNPSPPSPSNLLLSGGGVHDHQYHHLFNLEPQTSFSSSSLSSPIFLTPAQVQGGSDHYREPQKFQFQLLEADYNIVSNGGSYDYDHQTLENEGGNGTTLKFSISKNEADCRNENPSTHENSTSSVKWMSSKMRMMRKMTNPDQTSSSTTSSDDKSIAMNLSSHKFEEGQKLHRPSSQLGTDDHMISCSNNSSNYMNNVPIIRVCSDCNTTKTPLWRSGPRGPKSLCNACGIRQRKARRAMAAAAAAASGTTLGVVAAPSMKSTTSKVQHKDNKPRVASTVPFKKRPYNKLTSSPSSRGGSKKLCFEDFTISMDNKNSSSGTTTTTTSLQRVFPQDEKEAAILLMALSCGLVHG